MAEEQETQSPAPVESTPIKRKKTSKKKAKRKRAKKSVETKADNTIDSAKGRSLRNFPASTFEDALVLAEAFQKFAAGQTKVRKLTLFDKIGKSPDSGPSRQLITNSSRYGLTSGGYQAEFLELTPEGALASADDVPAPTKLQARFDLAIKRVEPFNFLYERCKGAKMPNKEFLIDALKESYATKAPTPNAWILSF